MPAPRRPWPPSRPSRPPSLHESACERASRPQLPFPSSSRDPSLLAKARTWRASGAKSGAGKPSNSLRARSGGGCGVRKRRRRGCVGCLMCGNCGSERVEAARRHTAARGGGGARGRRRWAAHAGGAGCAAVRARGGEEDVRRRLGPAASGAGRCGGVDERRCELGRTGARRREGKTEKETEYAGERDI